MKTTLVALSALFIMGMILVSFTYDNAVNQEPWEVPAKYEKMENPVSADSESISVGKTLYSKHCKSCHGSEGLGDGTKAEELDASCGDFSSEEFQSQSDGALFYKSYIGRDEMPNFEKKITDEEDVWHIINYMRTLAE